MNRDSPSNSPNRYYWYVGGEEQNIGMGVFLTQAEAFEMMLNAIWAKVEELSKAEKWSPTLVLYAIKICHLRNGNQNIVEVLVRKKQRLERQKSVCVVESLPNPVIKQFAWIAEEKSVENVIVISHQKHLRSYFAPLNVGSLRDQ